MSCHEKNLITGPYRATKLWNDAVRSFYNQMPLSRHWRGLRQYENCFTASEAVTWLHNYLISNPNFGSGVTREQSIKLLRKFFKCGLIIEARGNKIYAEDFQDNKELFKFNNQSPLKALRSPSRVPLAPIVANALYNSGSPVLNRTKHEKTQEANNWCNSQKENIYNEEKDEASLSFIYKHLNEKQINESWQKVFFHKLELISEQLMVGGEGSTPLLSMSAINAAWIRHNMTLLKSKDISRAEGFGTEELPNWILSAMKCLVNWPNPSDSVCNIPNYPGVEMDIFKVVREFFSNMVVPLIPYELYDPIVRLYIGAEFLDIVHRTPKSGSLNSSTNDQLNNLNNSLSSMSTYDSVEDLILNISSCANQQSLTPNACEAPRARTDLEKPQDLTPIKEKLVPRSPLVNNGFSSIPRSLRLNRLQHYTDFKDSYLYPHEERQSYSGSSNSANNSVEANESTSSNRVTLKSLKNKSKQTSRMNDARKDVSSTSTSPDFGSVSPIFDKLLKTEELDDFSLPPNSCFETAFTSDSPRTRIIPQKSVDTIHFRNCDHSLRPKSIAVSSFGDTLNAHSLNNLKLPTPLNQLCSQDVNSSFMNRSLSEGNLLIPKAPEIEGNAPSVVSTSSMSSLQKNTRGKLKKSSNSKGSLAARVRDSIKRKKGKDPNTKFYNKKSGKNCSYQVFRDSYQNSLENSTETLTSYSETDLNESQQSESLSRLKRLRTKSGGYANPALNLCSFSPVDSISVKSFSSELNQIRNSSGFMNNETNLETNFLKYLDKEQFHISRPVSCTPDSLSAGSDISSVHWKSHSPACGSTAASDLSSNSCQRKSCYNRSKSTTPNGCLSHSLSSTLSNSIYHSALSGLNQTRLSQAPHNSLVGQPSRDGEFAKGRSLSTTPEAELTRLHRRPVSTPPENKFGGYSARPLSTTSEIEGHGRIKKRPTSTPPELPKRMPALQLDNSAVFVKLHDEKQDMKEICSEKPMHLSSSANELSDDSTDRTPFGTVPPYFRGGLWQHYHCSPSKRLMGRRSRFQKACGNSVRLPGLLTKVGKEICIEALQLIILTLNPGRRRKLFLLLKMMSKVSSNDKLQLDDALTNRALMVKTFSRSVLLTVRERDYDEMLATRIVTFMMDNHAAIFAPPQNLAVLVHRDLNATSVDKKKAPNFQCGSVTSSPPITYCHQVSPQTYEDQKFSGSQKFLSELLDQILENPKLTDKEKRKKLKEFKCHYPEIYDHKFPPGKENQVFPLAEKKPKLKGLKKFTSIKSLTRSKSIRI